MICLLAPCFVAALSIPLAFPVTYPLGELATFLATADLDNDGNLDLVAVHSWSTGFSLLLGNGDGTFSPAIRFHIGTGSETVAIHDLDRDGNLDLLTGNPSERDFSVVLGNGNGTFGAETRYMYDGVGDPVDVAVGDFDEDGNFDVVTANGQVNAVAIFFGYGDGTFDTLEGCPLCIPFNRYNVGEYPSRVKVADFDSDGHQDLLTLNRYSFDPYDLSLLIGIGDGGFQPEVRIPIEHQTTQVNIEDFNDDGVLDLAFLFGGGWADISIRLGVGDGSFLPGIRSPTGSNPQHFAVSDLDSNGTLDLAISLFYQNRLQLLLGVGDGSFVLQPDWPLIEGDGPIFATAGDFDNDGHDDLAVLNGTSEDIFIILYPDSFPSVCDDADGDGFGYPGSPGCPGGALPDCDDSDPGIYPGALEIRGNTRDENCDGIAEDVDGDGFADFEGDCNDSDASIHPDAQEIFDGIDNNCNGLVDEIVIVGTCEVSPSSLNLQSRGNSLSIRVTLIDSISGSSIDPGLMTPVFISRLSSPGTGDIVLPIPRAEPGCDEFTDDGIWESFEDRTVTGGGVATLRFNMPSDGQCETMDGNRQDIIALMLDIPDGEVASLCITSTYPNAPDSFECCGIVSITNHGNR
jgi:hypothetical protein